MKDFLLYFRQYSSLPQRLEINLTDSEPHQQHIGIQIELILRICNGLRQQLVDATKYEQGKVIFIIANGLVVVGDGGGGLDEWLVDVGGFAVGDIVGLLLFEFWTQLGDEILFLHFVISVQQLYLFSCSINLLYRFNININNIHLLT